MSRSELQGRGGPWAVPRPALLALTRARSLALSGTLALAALAFALPAGTVTWADSVDLGPPLSVRVLLFETRGPIQVETAQARVRIRAARGGVAAGDGAVLPFWRSRASGPIRVAGTRGTSGAGVRVGGSVEVLPAEAGLMVINELPLEQYLVGLLAEEMYPGWKSAALQAQAVASRSYALHQCEAHAGLPYDLLAGTRNQVYGGLDSETESVRAAVEATRGQILTHRGSPILAAFHADAGGRTAASDEVWGEPLEYLVSHEVEGEDESPDTYWRLAVSRTTLGRALSEVGGPIGRVRRVEVVERSRSGRVARLAVEGTKGDTVVTGRVLRSALGDRALRSTLFDVRTTQDEIVFVGSGRGHGVGMSQWGARAMAERGASYREILKTFYPRTELVRIPRDLRVCSGGTG